VLPDAVLDGPAILEIQNQIPGQYGTDELREYVIDLARASRQHPDVSLGASPRAAIFLMRAARAHALVHGRTYYTHEDVQAVAWSVLGHRLILKPEAEVEGRIVADVIQELIETVPVLRASHGE
jgi:MoxR-like ATPase